MGTEIFQFRLLGAEKMGFKVGNPMSKSMTQVPTSIIFVKKMAQRCGVWQIKRMTSQDQDQVSMKSNMFGFRGYSQMKF